MALEGKWKNPPQCIRAVLIPTPELGAACREVKDTRQYHEFGRVLATLWKNFAELPSPCRSSEALDGTAEEPQVRSSVSSCAASPMFSEISGIDGFDDTVLTPRVRDGSRRMLWTYARRIRAQILAASQLHWARQVWLHLTRNLLVMSRSIWPAIAANIFFTLIAIVAFALAFPSVGFTHLFQKNSLMLLLVALAQSVSSQRIFGGEEREVAKREAAVVSLPQMLYSFVGKDMASIVEMSFASASFALTHWQLVSSNMSITDLVSIGFSFLYAVWGLNYIWSILLPSKNALLLVIVVPFLNFILCGVSPDVEKLTDALGVGGGLLVLASPIRWALSRLVYLHVTGYGSTYVLQDTQQRVSGNFRDKGFDVKFLSSACSKQTTGVLKRWMQRDGWMCHSGQLFLLGLLFRFVAVICLLFKSGAEASGGQLVLGMPAPWQSRALKHALYVQLVFVFIFELVLLGHTY